MRHDDINNNIIMNVACRRGSDGGGGFCRRGSDRGAQYRTSRYLLKRRSLPDIKDHEPFQQSEDVALMMIARDMLPIDRKTSENDNDLESVCSLSPDLLELREELALAEKRWWSGEMPPAFDSRRGELDFYLEKSINLTTGTVESTDDESMCVFDLRSANESWLSQVEEGKHDSFVFPHSRAIHFFAGISMALASDALALQLLSYEKSSILHSWLHRVIPMRQLETKDHWMIGVPVLGSALVDGKLLFMNDSWLSDDNGEQIRIGGNLFTGHIAF